MHNATQTEIDAFYASTENDPNIFPFIGISKFMPLWEAQKDNNSKIILTDKRISYLLNMSFNWHRVLEVEIALFAKTPIAAGRGLLAMQEMVKRYSPRAINTSVQESNLKSLKINTKLFGEPWGREKEVAWNPLKGCYEDLFYFRKLM